jgi:hypothetical protein
MIDITCKTEDEVIQIIAELQRENPKLEEILIRKAIASCCKQTEIVSSHETFMGCIKERIRMLRLM